MNRLGEATMRHPQHVAEMTEAETARMLYDRVRRDSNYLMAPYRVVNFVAEMIKRDPFVVLHAIGVERVVRWRGSARPRPRRWRIW